jgi:hypothetical protein
MDEIENNVENLSSFHIPYYDYLIETKNNEDIEIFKNLIEDNILSIQKILLNQEIIKKDNNIHNRLIIINKKFDVLNEIVTSRKLPLVQQPVAPAVVPQKAVSPSKVINAKNIGYEIINDKPNIYLINAIGDGDCFINAIFDYGIYTNKIEEIYNKLYNIRDKIRININKLYIQSYQTMHTHLNEKLKLNYKFNKINKFNDNASNATYKKILESSLFKINDIPKKYLSSILKDSYEKNYYTHIDLGNKDDPEKAKIHYNIFRKEFIRFMKYMFALYTYTIYFEEFKKLLLTRLGLGGIELFNNSTGIDWAEEIKAYLNNNVQKYYENDIFKQDLIEDFAFNYISIYATTEYIYCTEIEINIFKKMLDSPNINDDNNFSKFYINTPSLKNLQTKNFEIIRYTYKLTKDTSNIYNYISLINENNSHYLLCLYDDEFTMETYI